MLPKLTERSIERILNGQIIYADVVMQVLGCRKVTLDEDIEKHRYQLVISDGADFYSFAVLHKKLHSHIINKNLEMFAIIRVDQWVCKQEKTGREIIVIIDLAILIPGAEVGAILGNPVNYETTMSRIRQRSMISNLTEGSIERILYGETIYADVVIQVLGYKKVILEEDIEKLLYQLVISDGINSYSFVVLHKKLHGHIINHDLEMFTIIRVDEWVCKKEKTGCKAIIITNLTILIPGAEVGVRLGNPVNYATSSDANVGAMPYIH